MFTNKTTLRPGPYKYTHPNSGVVRISVVDSVVSGRIKNPLEIVRPEKENQELKEKQEEPSA